MIYYINPKMLNIKWYISVKLGILHAQNKGKNHLYLYFDLVFCWK